MKAEGCERGSLKTGLGGLRSCENEALKTGMAYLVAALVIAAASAVYGLFSHGVQSYYMTYAFMVPLLGGAMPYLIAALKGRIMSAVTGTKDIQLAIIATLTAGCLLKGALDIYGTTNRLLIGYPVLAAAMVAALIIKKVRHKSADGLNTIVIPESADCGEQL